MTQWHNYLDTIEKYKNLEYTRLEKAYTNKMKAKWVGGIFAHGKVYGVINSAREGLCICPETKSFKLFGEVSVGTFKWTGGCFYQGKIYGLPRKDNQLLVIDGEKEAITVKKLPIEYRGEHHYGGVCTEEGIVYQPPRNSDHILRINLNTLEVKQIRIAEKGMKCRYSSAVMHPNGNIYMIPEQGGRVLVFHVDSEEVEYIGTEQKDLVFGAVVGSDRNIYGFCREGKGLYKINVNRGTVEKICIEIGEPDCYGSVVGVNGKIIGIPACGESVWEFDVETQSAKKLFELHEKGVAKCAGAGVGKDGTICMIPAFGEYIYFLSPEEKITTEGISNRYFNTSY